MLRTAGSVGGVSGCCGAHETVCSFFIRSLSFILIRSGGTPSQPDYQPAPLRHPKLIKRNRNEQLRQSDWSSRAPGHAISHCATGIGRNLSGFPRVQDRDPKVFIVLDVTGHHHQIMPDGGGSEECVHNRTGASSRFRQRGNIAPALSDRERNGQDTFREPRHHFVVEPVFKSRASVTCRERCDTFSNFSDRQDADKHKVFGLAKKIFYPRLGRSAQAAFGGTRGTRNSADLAAGSESVVRVFLRRFCKLGKDIRIDKVTIHNEISRPVS